MRCRSRRRTSSATLSLTVLDPEISIECDSSDHPYIEAEYGSREKRLKKEEEANEITSRENQCKEREKSLERVFLDHSISILSFEKIQVDLIRDIRSSEKSRHVPVLARHEALQEVSLSR